MAENGRLMSTMTALTGSGRSAKGAWLALMAGWVSSSIVDATDVGMSYGAVAVLGTFTAAIPRRWRAAWAGGWVAVGVGSAVIRMAGRWVDVLRRSSRTSARPSSAPGKRRSVFTQSRVSRAWSALGYFC